MYGCVRRTIHLNCGSGWPHPPISWTPMFRCGQLEIFLSVVLVFHVTNLMTSLFFVFFFPMSCMEKKKDVLVLQIMHFLFKLNIRAAVEKSS